MIIISVHDKVAGTWSPPAVTENKDSAVRDFRTACRKPGSMLSEHPEDFELWLLGEWSVPYDLNKMPTLSVFTAFEYVETGASNERKS